MASGVIPQISAIMGAPPVQGERVYSAQLWPFLPWCGNSKSLCSSRTNVVKTWLAPAAYHRSDAPTGRGNDPCHIRGYHTPPPLPPAETPHLTPCPNALLNKKLIKFFTPELWRKFPNHSPIPKYGDSGKVGKHYSKKSNSHRHASYYQWKYDDSHSLRSTNHNAENIV